jgi:hypothetical protein
MLVAVAAATKDAITCAMLPDLLPSGQACHLQHKVMPKLGPLESWQLCQRYKSSPHNTPTAGLQNMPAKNIHDKNLQHQRFNTPRL